MDTTKKNSKIYFSYFDKVVNRLKYAVCYAKLIKKCSFLTHPKRTKSCRTAWINALGRRKNDTLKNAKMIHLKNVCQNVYF